jgi:hypothetical protein
MDTYFVNSIYAAVVDSGPELAKKYPELKKVMAIGRTDWQDWEFNLIAASICLAGMLIEDDLERDSIFAQAKKLDDSLLGAVQHLNSFINENAAAQGVNHIIGIWILINLAGKVPDYKYVYRLAPSVGALAILIVQHAGISVDKIEFK